MLGLGAYMKKHTLRAKLANEFFSRYRSRIVAALPKYGEFNPETDKRNMGTEAIEEILDVGSYLEFSEAMRPEFQAFIQRMRAKTIALYAMGQELEEMMQTEKKERTP